MIIDFKKQMVFTTEHYIEIEDIKNCYLRGNRDNTGFIDYLGVWQTNRGIVICKILNADTIEIELIRDIECLYYSDVKSFLVEHSPIEILTKEVFMDFFNNKLENIKE